MAICRYLDYYMPAGEGIDLDCISPSSPSILLLSRTDAITKGIERRFNKERVVLTTLMNLWIQRGFSVENIWTILSVCTGSLLEKVRVCPDHLVEKIRCKNLILFK